MTEIPLVIGRKYRIRYRTGQQQIDRELVGLFLGVDWQDEEEDKINLSLRPEGGTTYLYASQLRGVPEEVSTREACYADKKVGARDGR